jgi:phosphatidylinositol 3-kinase
MGEVPYPLDIEKVLKCPIPSECFMFKSAMAPFCLTFELVGGGKFTFIYKNGDDLRQDQLILGFFVLMDKLLKQVNLDYRLTPYQALACSKSDGFVEYVPSTKTFQSVVLKDYLQELIKKHPETAMENYIFSTSGYCAITYFFMIGDRHL